MRDARGPVGAPRSAGLADCITRGDTGWFNAGKAGIPAGDADVEAGRIGCAVASWREAAGAF